MNEEQMKQFMSQFSAQIGTIVNNAISEYDKKRKEEEAEAKKKAEEERKKREAEDDKLKKAEEEIRKQKEAKTAEQLEKDRMLNAFKFSSTLKDYLEQNREYLPENIADLINILQAKTYDSDVEKAQELKRAIVEQYVKEQKRLDLLPDHLKKKAETFAGLSTKEKLAQADNYYDIVETGVHTEKNIKKIEEIEKGGSGSGNDVVTDYENKMLEFSKNTMTETGGDKK